MFNEWFKELFCFVIFLIPIWFLRLVEISLSWKLLFTLGVGIGIFLYFETGMQLRSRRYGRH